MYYTSYNSKYRYYYKKHVAAQSAFSVRYKLFFSPATVVSTFNTVHKK